MKKARNMKIEREIKEKKVFFVEDNWTSELTQPKPFNLQYKTNFEKIQRKRMEIVQNQMKDCIFHPNINNPKY